LYSEVNEKYEILNTESEIDFTREQTAISLASHLYFKGPKLRVVK